MTLRIKLPRCWVIDPPPPWCVILEMPTIWKWLREPDPWRGRIPDFNIPIRDLDVDGPAFFAVPSVGIAINPAARVRPKLSAGAGLFWERGRDTDISGVGTFSIETMTSPAAAFGVGLDVSLSSQVSLAVSARGLVTFMGDFEITTPTGRVQMDGATMLSESLTAGLSFAF